MYRMMSEQVDADVKNGHQCINIILCKVYICRLTAFHLSVGVVIYFTL